MFSKIKKNNNLVLFGVILSVIFSFLLIGFSVKSQSIFETSRETAKNKTRGVVNNLNYAKVPIYNERILEDEEKPHTLVGGYYNVRNGIESKLLLNNKVSWFSVNRTKIIIR